MKKLYLIFLMTAVLGLTLFFLGGQLKVSGQGLIPFGGRIMVVEYCCNGVAITVGPPRPGRFLLTAGAIPFPYYNFYTPGPYVLGTAIPPLEPCFEVVAACLVPIPVTGQITKIGSSAF